MKLYNTLTRSLEDFQPLTGKQVSVYTCGLTVYSQPHIGNWVSYIYWDVLVKTLIDAGYEVKRVQNITDVGHLTSDEDSGEDKMEKGARAENLTAWNIADKYIKIADHEAFDMLGLSRPDEMPRATDYILEQVAFVQELENKGFTYEIPGDGVYFDTSKLKDYGKLARLDITGLKMGARIENTGKRSPTDFALWKFSPQGQKRDMEWESPWGVGFPGWHLECSVMARELLGDQIDIHTGGIDHIPVHHTNEIAQTEAVTGKQFSKYWLHNNHLKVDGEKMSKSLGNIYTLQDVLDHGFDIEAFKLTILAKHYRTEGNFTWDILQASQNRLQSYRAMADQIWQAVDRESTVGEELIAHTKAGIQSSLRNDINTPEALVFMGQLETAIDTHGLNIKDTAAFRAFLEWTDTIFGFNLGNRPDITEKHTQILAERSAARTAKNWELSDRLRDQLHDEGIMVKDTSYGQIWSRLR